jgi:hypothetical protein
MEKAVLEINSEDTESLMKVLAEIIEKQTICINPISVNNRGKNKIELSADNNF